ncbi:MAG: threonine synthase [Bacillota bacterium]|jgi:threonine synthase
MWTGLINRYRDLLPVSEATPVVTLHEGNTPLLPLPAVSAALPGLTVYAKYEGANPTGSFKDRGMTLAVSKAREAGARAVICASTGNTAAAAAAYAARAGLECVVLIPEGKIALGKLSQALHLGAKVIAVDGNFDQALAITREIVEEYPITLVNSINPFRIAGQQTAAWEIIEQLGEAPDYLAIPVGNAGNITAYWRGFKVAAQRDGQALPKMLGFEALGSAAIVRGEPIAQPETVATAIRIGNPASWQQAVQAQQESGGVIDAVSDEEILAAYRWLGRAEGVFCEPASAAGLAGVRKLYQAGYFSEPATVVCVLTGNGLKDPDNAMAAVPQPARVVADKTAIIETIWR